MVSVIKLVIFHKKKVVQVNELMEVEVSSVTDISLIFVPSLCNVFSCCVRLCSVLLKTRDLGTCSRIFNLNEFPTFDGVLFIEFD